MNTIETLRELLAIADSRTGAKGSYTFTAHSRALADAIAQLEQLPALQAQCKAYKGAMCLVADNTAQPSDLNYMDADNLRKAIKQVNGIATAALAQAAPLPTLDQLAVNPVDVKAIPEDARAACAVLSAMLSLDPHHIWRLLWRKAKSHPKPAPSHPACATCGDTGRLSHPSDPTLSTVPCPTCQPAAYPPAVCAACGGEGHIDKPVNACGETSWPFRCTACGGTGRAK